MAEVHTRAERDYMLGMKYQDIADKYKVTINTVKSWKTRHGWERDKKKSAPKAKKGVHTKTKTKRVQNTPVVLPEENEKLTEKQKLFCLFYVKNKNAALAVIKAGYEVSNSQRAAEIGYQLLHNPPVRQECNRLKELKRQSIMLDPNDIVEKYMQIAFADMTDVAEWGTEEIVDIDKAGNIQIDQNGNVKKIKRIYFNLKDHNQVDGGLISEIKMGSQGLSVKLQNSQKALEWLSNFFNMNPMNQHKQRYDNAVLALREKESARNDW
jgi:phage terminase small subunit